MKESALQVAINQLYKSQLVLKDSSASTGLIEIKVVEEILQNFELELEKELLEKYKPVNY